MQPVVTPERGAYTADQVKSIIRNESAILVSAGCELLNQNLDVLADLTDDFVDGEVKRSNYANIHGIFTFSIARELPWGQAIVRPYMVISDGTISPRFNLGAYYTNTPRRKLGTQPLEYSVEGYDLLHALSTPTGEAYSVAAGTRYLDAVIDCLNNLGFTKIRVDGLRRNTVLNPNPRSWPLDEATTWLTVINDLLAAIGYRGIWVDWNGFFVCERYETPTTRQSEWAYDTDPDYSILSPDREYERDFFTAPNRWVGIRNSNTDGPAPVEGNGVYTYVNQNRGETSVQARGRVINRILGFDAVDQAALIAQVMKSVENDLTLKTKIDVKTGSNPLHWHFDVVELTDPEAGAKLKLIESEWSLPLRGADMTHVWSAV